jgi:ubiquinone/menaquinone biosynthesis C-methylase UbiE
VNGKRIINFDASSTKQTPISNRVWPESVQKAIRKYDTKQKAEKFASGVRGTRTDRREKRCVTKALALAKVAAGASVLDLPCGTGRLLPLLKKLGYKVTAADVSAAMVVQAHLYAGPSGENCLDDTDELRVANVLQTGFDDNRFDAVICHRLLQYFPEAEVRQQALKELRRICRSPIIVSFLCSLATDAVVPYVREALLNGRRRGCVPIGLSTFARDVHESGLVVKKWIPMRPFISTRWYALLVRDGAHNNCTLDKTHQ